MSPPSAPGSRTSALTAYGVTGLLGEFSAAGVLGVADVRTALAVTRIGSESDERVGLALALAVRAVRNGSVCVDLATVSTVVFDEDEESLDLAALPWPEPAEWLTACAVSPLVATGPDAPPGRPLRINDGLLYLDRYWQQEEFVRTQLQARYAAAPPATDPDRLAAALTRLFPPRAGADDYADQRLAAAAAAVSWLTVLAGAPGTGKTTTVARLLALLADQPGPPLRIALAAPTGKAAARLEEAVRSATAQLDEEDRGRLGDLSAATVHRLLGWLPASQGRFRHHAQNQLPHDVVIVDEMSMVSLTLTARLLEAVRPSARLILVGDPDQLSSVEAGAVLADIVSAPGRSPAGAAGPLRGLGVIGPSEPPPVHGVVRLRHNRRFGDDSPINVLAQAIRAADADAALEVLRGADPAVRFLELAGSEPTLDPRLLATLHRSVVTSAREVHRAALAGDAAAALRAMDQHRLLCAHRRGPYGVLRWSVEIERQLGAAIPSYGEDGEWYAGRPLLVTANDYEMGLYNGDTGVIIAAPAGRRAAFARGVDPVLYAPVRLDSIQTVHAMTVHRAQGSQFAGVSLILPPETSPLLTRELLYTAVTRASERVQIFGTAEAVRRAIARPANRASGLSGRLSPLEADGPGGPSSA